MADETIYEEEEDLAMNQNSSPAEGDQRSQRQRPANEETKVVLSWRRPAIPLFSSFNTLSMSVLDNLYKVSGNSLSSEFSISRTVVIDLVKLPDNQRWLILSGIREYLQAAALFPLATKPYLGMLRISENPCSKKRWSKFEKFLTDLAKQKVDEINGCKEGEVVYEQMPLVTVNGPCAFVELSMALLCKSVETCTLRSTLSARVIRLYPAEVAFYLKPALKREDEGYSAIDSTVPALMGGFAGSTNEDIAERLGCKHFALHRWTSSRERNALKTLGADQEFELRVSQKCKKIAGLLGTIFMDASTERLITKKLPVAVVDIFCKLFPIAKHDELIFWLGLSVVLHEYKKDAFGIAIRQLHPATYRMIVNNVVTLRQKDHDKKILGNFNMDLINIVLQFKSVMEVVPLEPMRIAPKTSCIVKDLREYDTDKMQLVCKAVDALGAKTVVRRYLNQTEDVVAHFVSGDELPGELPATVPGGGYAEVETQDGMVDIESVMVQNITTRYSTDPNVYLAEPMNNLNLLSRNTRIKLVQNIGPEPKLYFGRRNP